MFSLNSQLIHLFTDVGGLADGRGCSFDWVARHRSCDAEVFMKAALQGNGWTAESLVRVLADGADGLANLVSGAAEKRTPGA
jgi:hypothetical protein